MIHIVKDYNGSQIIYDLKNSNIYVLIPIKIKNTLKKKLVCCVLFYFVHMCILMVKHNRGSSYAYK